MGNVYFISDTHFGHLNILKYEPIRLDALADYWGSHGDYESRDCLRKRYDEMLFGTDEEKLSLIREHDELLIMYWNSVVKNDDTVWFLGDFAFPKYIGLERVKEIGHKLKGHKRMIMGNHDKEKIEFYYSCGFEFVSPYPIILKKWFILSHAPIPYMNAHTPFANIYGHVHSHEGFKTTTENTVCVCVERTNFRPIRIKAFDDFEEVDFTNPARERRRKDV